MDDKTRERFYEFFADWLRMQKGYEDVARVTSVEQVTKSGGYCESCYSEWEEVNIAFVRTDKSGGEYEYYGSIAEFFDVNKY